MSLVEVRAYDPEWPRTFEGIRANVWPAIQHAAMSLEHVGSTSVPGLRAKPVIDACIVVASRRDIPHVVKALGSAFASSMAMPTMSSSVTITNWSTLA